MFISHYVHYRCENFLSDESATFKTLNELRGRGIKVDLGFPEEMWDTPDAEIVRLKTQVHGNFTSLGGKLHPDLSE